MQIPSPHFLLFAEAVVDGRRGRWRFMLQAVDDGQSLEAESTEICASDQRLQLLAVVRGLEALDQPSRVTLVTASRYVQRGFRFGLREWRQTGWQWEKFGVKEPIPNDDLWRRIDQALRFHRVTCRRWQFAASADVAAAADELETGWELPPRTAAVHRRRGSGEAPRPSGAAPDRYEIRRWRGWKSAGRWATSQLARLGPKTAAITASVWSFCC